MILIGDDMEEFDLVIKRAGLGSIAPFALVLPACG
jgi:hypothetical protein